MNCGKNIIRLEADYKFVMRGERLGVEGAQPPAAGGACRALCGMIPQIEFFLISGVEYPVGAQIPAQPQVAAPIAPLKVNVQVAAPPPVDRTKEAESKLAQKEAELATQVQANNVLTRENNDVKNQFTLLKNDFTNQVNVLT